MDISLRKGIKQDLPLVLALIKELADYENALDQVSVTLEQLEKDGFEGHPLRKDYPLLSRRMKPWPGIVDVEAMPGEEK